MDYYGNSMTGIKVGLCSEQAAVRDGLMHTIIGTNEFTTSGDVIDLELIVPDNNRRTYIYSYVLCSAYAFQTDLYEAPTSAGGVVLTNIHNRNRNNTDICDIIFKADISVLDTGKLIETGYHGISGSPAGKLNVGGDTGGFHEWILKNDTKYLVRMTARDDLMRVNVIINIMTIDIAPCYFS